jgi:hypothetical protein
MESELFVHIGPGRTGTTYLQQDVFESLKNVRVITHPALRTDSGWVEFGEVFLFSPYIWMDDNANILERMIHKSCKSIPEKLLISSENIHGGFGFPPIGWTEEPPRTCEQYDLRFHSRHDPSALRLHLRFLSQAATKLGFDDVKVIFTTRRQDTKIASEYAQLSDRIKRASQDNFLRWARNIIKKPFGYYKSGGVNLDYYRLAKNIEEVVDRKNLMITVFEEMKHDPQAYLGKITEFLGGEMNDKKGLNTSPRNSKKEKDKTWEIRSLRKETSFGIDHELLDEIGVRNNIMIPIYDFLFRASRFRLTKGLSEDIINRYDKSNQKLEKYVDGVDLSYYGYY